MAAGNNQFLTRTNLGYSGRHGFDVLNLRLELSSGHGKPVGPLSGGGGSFALLTEEGEVLHGPGNKGGWLTGSRENSREPFTSPVILAALLAAGAACVAVLFFTKVSSRTDN